MASTFDLAEAIRQKQAARGPAENARRARRRRVQRAAEGRSRAQLSAAARMRRQAAQGAHSSTAAPVFVFPNLARVLDDCMSAVNALQARYGRAVKDAEAARAEADRLTTAVDRIRYDRRADVAGRDDALNAADWAREDADRARADADRIRQQADAAWRPVTQAVAEAHRVAQLRAWWQSEQGKAQLDAGVDALLDATDGHTCADIGRMGDRHAWRVPDAPLADVMAAILRRDVRAGERRAVTLARAAGHRKRNDTLRSAYRSATDF